jgi:integrase
VRSGRLGRIRPYDLRHSHACLLIDIGAHPKAISERMGHTEIGVTTSVYEDLFEGKQRELTSDLNDLLHRTRSTKRSAHGDEATEAGEDENRAP